MTRALHLKGLWVPRLFIWLLGFIHGKITKTAVIDGQSGLVSSGWVTAKRRLFDELVSKRVERLELELKGARAEAANLMTEEAFLRHRIRDWPAESRPVTVNEKRSARRSGAEKSAATGRYSQIIHRLVELDGKIRSRELTAGEHLEPETNTAGQYAMLFLVGIEPLATSACAFFISYEDSRERRKRLAMAINAIKIQEQIDRIDAERQELASDMEFDLEEYDRRCRQTMEDVAEAKAELAKIRVREILAETEATPEAVSYLMENGWKEDKADAA